MKSLSKLNMNLNELLGAVLENVNEIPTTGVQGQIIFYTVNHALLYYNGTKWMEIGISSITNAVINSSGHLILTLSNSTEYDCGVCRVIPQEISYTLLATGWSTDTYVISNEAILLNSDGYIECAPTITVAQYDAIAKAKTVRVSQAAGSFTIKALGTIPTIDIPIKLVIC